MGRMPECAQEQEVRENLSGLPNVTNHEPIKTWIWHERTREMIDQFDEISKQTKGCEK